MCVPCPLQRDRPEYATLSLPHKLLHSYPEKVSSLTLSPPLPHPLPLPLERLTAQESGGYGGRGKYTVRVRVCCVRQSGVCVSIILPLFRMLSPSPSLILMMPVPLLLSY